MVKRAACARCSRCGVIVLFTSPETDALMQAHRLTYAREAATNPDVDRGFFDWLTGEAYWDGAGYRLKSNRRRRADWSKAAVKLYPNCDDFHEAAHLARKAA